MSQLNQVFRHVRLRTKPSGVAPAGSGDNMGGVTLVLQANRRLKELQDNDIVNVGVAFCSAADNFSRQRGREIAEARLKAAPLQMDGSEVRRLLDTNLGSIHDMMMALVVSDTPAAAYLMDGIHRAKLFGWWEQ